MSKFKVATYNANSIRARMPQIRAWLEREAPDVLCVQETKVRDKDFPVAEIESAGYHVVFRGQKSHAGVAILSRTEPAAVAAGFTGDEDDLGAAHLLRATYAGIAIVNTYVPQGRDAESEHFQEKLAWFGRLRELFERHYTPQEQVLWCGDFNVAPEDVDVHDPKRLRGHVDFHPEAQTALEKIRAWGFVDLFRKHHAGETGHYSYWDYRARNPVERGVGWRVDHVWATAPLAGCCTASWIDTAARQEERPSDHTFVVAEFDI